MPAISSSIGLPHSLLTSEVARRRRPGRGPVAGFDKRGAVIASVPVSKNTQLKPQLRFGIGEWYGTPLTALSADARRKLSEMQALAKSQKPIIPCPFQSTSERIVACNKPGGVCTLRLYEKSPQTGEVKPATGELGHLRTVCPARFEEGLLIYRWVARTILSTEAIVTIGEIGFLERLHRRRLKQRHQT